MKTWKISMKFSLKVCLAPVYNWLEFANQTSRLLKGKRTRKEDFFGHNPGGKKMKLRANWCHYIADSIDYIWLTFGLKGAKFKVTDIFSDIPLDRIDRGLIGVFVTNLRALHIARTNWLHTPCIISKVANI